MNHVFNQQVRLSESGVAAGTGWLPPTPDLRDYTPDHPSVADMNRGLGMSNKSKATLVVAPSVDLRQWCSPVENQGGLGSCTAHAAVGIVEYFQRRAFGKHVEGSRLFVYKNTRNLMGVIGDTGAWLRNTMGALALCGVPLEQYWPYTDQSPDFDDDPPTFVFSIAENFEALTYFCHDPQGMNVDYPTVLESVKKYIAAGIPSMFGFWGFPSSEQANVKGAFAYPCAGESAIWGHAVAAVGYDDSLKIKNTVCPNVVTTGALLIRNSWGTAWGDKGYGWIPYAYVLNGLANDFWSLVNMEWVETKNFGL